MGINQKKAGVAIVTSDKVDFMSEIVTRDKKRLLYNDKVSTQPKIITIVNIYAPNIRAPKYIKQILTD